MSDMTKNGELTGKDLEEEKISDAAVSEASGGLSEEGTFFNPESPLGRRHDPKPQDGVFMNPKPEEGVFMNPKPEEGAMFTPKE